MLNKYCVFYISCIAALSLSACTEVINPLYCDTDLECLQNSRAGKIDQELIYCFNEGHFCYPGCKDDGDCQGDIAVDGVKGNWLSGLICDAASNQCVMGSSNDQGIENDNGADAGEDVTLFELGESCESASECKSNFCTDSVCCEKDDCGACQRCDINSQGLCANVTDNTDPDNDCLGIDNECKGSCVDGACAWPTSACGTLSCPSSTAAYLQSATCNQGACDGPSEKAQDCSDFLLCDTLNHICKTGCESHLDCQGGDQALCDRTQADITGLGSCVDPSLVVVLSSGSSTTQLHNAVSALGNDQWLKIESETYTNVAITIGQDKIKHLVANGDVIFRAALGANAIIDTQANGQATIQGISFDASSGSDDKPVIQCNASTGSAITIVESTLKNAKATGVGLNAYNCNITIRRSTINNNYGGGLKLSDGSFTLVNNLILANGNLNNLFGGVSFSNATSVSFIHNTVYQNLAASDKPSGVKCDDDTTQTLEYSIITGNISNKQTNGCNPTHSSEINSSNTCNLNTDQKPQNTQCLDNAKSNLLLDHNSIKRNTDSDLGCFEVK